MEQTKLVKPYKKPYSVEYNVCNCQYIFKLGFSFVCVSAYFPLTEENSMIKKERLKKINELENDKSTVIVYQDEAYFRVAASITRKWVEPSTGNL